MRFHPVYVEVTHSPASELTILTIERLQFVMNLTDVLPQIDGSHEGFLTSVTLMLYVVKKSKLPHKRRKFPKNPLTISIFT